MKILFNCTTNVVGGATKNSAIFIKHALMHDEINWVFAVSKAVQEILDKWDISSDNIHLFEISPSQDKIVRQKLYNLAKEQNVDLVYTMAGPAYVNFKKKHVLGMSNAYVTHTDYQGLSIGRSPIDIIKRFLLSFYQGYHARKADFWLFQTNESRNKFIKRYLIDERKTRVISNAIGNEFTNHYKNKDKCICNLKRTIQILTPAADYPHKVLHLIPKIAEKLHIIANNEYNFEFILTINHNSKLWNKINLESRRLSVEQYIKNVGPYNYANVLELFDKANIIFVPSILETFSASYLEAFSSKRSLIVADKGFAKDICQEAALYVDPFNAQQTADTIDKLIRNEKLQTQLITQGTNIIKKYGNQEERINTIIDHLASIIQNKTKRI